jgi:hypothetical protein
VTDGPDDRPSGPSRPRPTFLPPEEPPEQTEWDPEFPPPPRAGSSKTLPTVIVAALVLTVAAIWYVAQRDESPGPASTTTAAVAKVRFRRLPPACSMVSAPTVRRLVADAATLSGPGPTQVGRVTARCGWDDSYDPRKRHRFRDQSLKVDLAAHLSDSVMPGLDSAKIGFDSRWDVNRQTASEGTGGRVFTYGPVMDVTGLGDEAFSTFTTVDAPALGGHLPSTATITMRISNAVVEVTYSATDEHGTALTDRAARAAAENAARDVAAALIACTTCAD